jgi:hypothetical protein
MSYSPAHYRENHRQHRRLVFSLLCCLLVIGGLSLRFWAAVSENVALAKESDNLNRASIQLRWEFLKEVGQFIAVTFSVALIWEWFLQESQRKEFRLELEHVVSQYINGGVRRVHCGRPHPDVKATFISGAKFEVVEIGTALRTLGAYLRDTGGPAFRKAVEDNLRSGVRFGCILLDPDSTYANNNAAVKAKVIDSLVELREQQKTLHARIGKTFEVHLRQSQPRMSAVCVDCGILTDKAGSEARILISPYLDGLENRENPTLEIYRAHNPEFFEAILTSVQAIKSGCPSIVDADNGNTNHEL